MNLWIKRCALPLAGLVLALAACDLGEPTAAPSGSPRLSTLTDPSGQAYVVAEGQYRTRTTAESALIGRSGGKLGVGGHQLIVPAGAVDRPTRFTVTMSQERSPAGNLLVKVDNTAFQQDPGGAWTIDVGRTGFLKPVTLSMSYAWAVNVADPARLVILWDQENGTTQPQPTTLDPVNKMVVAQLTHFSIYAVGSSARDGQP